MLIMNRKAIVQGLLDRLKDSQEINLIYEPDYDKADNAIFSKHINIALIEATETGPNDIAYCLILCKKLRKHNPDCKLLLMCSELDDSSVKIVVDAKWKKQIDDFVFYDVTGDYLASKLLSI